MTSPGSMLPSGSPLSAVVAMVGADDLVPVPSPISASGSGNADPMTLHALHPRRKLRVDRKRRPFARLRASRSPR
jgi:hypothetical protein